MDLNGLPVCSGHLRLRVVSLFLLTLLIIPGNALGNPSFTIGSNHYLTIHAYPHDLLKWPNRGVFLSYNPKTMPWQGDVTDIANRPSPTYVHNHQEIEFAPPSGYEGNPEDVRSWMNVSSYAHKTRYSLGGLSTSQYGKFLVEIGKTDLNMELLSEGVGRSSDSGTYHLVPFNAETNAARNDYDFRVIYANRLFGNPIGAKLSHSRKSSDQPDGHLRFTKDGVSYNTPHLTWGWATTGCNHILGYSSINTDAFFQNRYSVLGGHQTDLQLSYEYKGNYKSGLRYRSTTEDGESYSWEYDDGSDILGNYHNDELWKDRRSNKFLRGYSKVRFWQVGNLDAGFLFFLQYGSQSKKDINKLAESESDSEEREREIILEANPFCNYKFHRGYLDFGLLLEISRTGMSNVRTRWNSVSKSDQPGVLWTTSPYKGWSPSWESFSRGHRWFFATGFEAYSSIPAHKRLSLLLRMMVLRKYTFTKKIYGESTIPEGSNSYEFNQTAERSDYKNETWMTGSVGISYGFGPVQAFWTLELPLPYLIKHRTSLRDSDDLLFEHSRKNVWQVQQPTSTRILLVYSLERP